MTFPEKSFGKFLSDNYGLLSWNGIIEKAFLTRVIVTSELCQVMSLFFLEIFLAIPTCQR